MKRYFIIGSDTGAGKTTVAVALLAAAHARGLIARGFKPIESGCRPGPDGALIPVDAVALGAASGAEQPLDQLNLLALEAPLAPAHAARRAGRDLDLAAIVAAERQLAATAPDLLLIEGAGGLLVPLTHDASVLDLAIALRAPLVIVARDGLGTINHASLTIREARRHGLAIAGLILSAAAGPVAALDVAENAAAITRLTDVALLGHLPLQPDLSPGALARAAEQHLALDRLL